MSSSLDYLLNEILNSVNEHLKVFDMTYGKVDSRFIFIHLTSSIEELSKYIFLTFLHKCKYYMVDKYGLPDQLLSFFSPLMKSIEKLDKDHKFKYVLFLVFYGILSGGLTYNYIESAIKDAEMIERLRSLYMTSITRRSNLKIDEDFIKDLREKIRFLLLKRKELEAITIGSKCDEITSVLEGIWTKLRMK